MRDLGADLRYSVKLATGIPRLAVDASSPHVAFGCGSEHQLLLIRYTVFAPWLEGMNETTKNDRTYKHISIFRVNDRFELVRRQGYPRIDLTAYLVKD